MANITISEIENVNDEVLDAALAAEEKFAVICDSKFLNGYISYDCHKRLSTFFTRALLRAIALNNSSEIEELAPRVAEECFAIASASRSYGNEISSNKDLADALDKYASAINKIKEALE